MNFKMQTSKIRTFSFFFVLVYLLCHRLLITKCMYALGGDMGGFRDRHVVCRQIQNLSAHNLKNIANELF